MSEEETMEQTDGPVVVEVPQRWGWHCPWCDTAQYGVAERLRAQNQADLHRHACPKRPWPLPSPGELNEALAPLGVRVEGLACLPIQEPLYRIVPVERRQ